MSQRKIAKASKRPTAARPGASSAAELDEKSARVLGQFRQIFNAVKTHFQAMERSAGIGGAQLWALSVIRDRPGIGVNELAGALGIHQSTASNLLKTLVKRKLITAGRSEEDRRAVELEVLGAGREILRRTPGPLTGVLPTALASLDQKSLTRLEKELSVLITALGADEKAARMPLAQILTKPGVRRRMRPR